MVRNYEIGFLLREGQEIENTVTRIKEYLERVNASMLSEESMGIRNLAYEIRKNREKFHKAFYYFVKAKTDPASLPELERLLKFDDSVIRYMILREK